jgi:hypothetical protein
MPQPGFKWKKMGISLKRKVVKCGNEAAFTAYGKKIYVRSEKNIRAADKLVDFRPIEIPKTKIEDSVRERKSLQFCIRVFFDPLEIPAGFLLERIGKNNVFVFRICLQKIFQKLQSVFPHSGNTRLLKASGVESDSHGIILKFSFRSA